MFTLGTYKRIKSRLGVSMLEMEKMPQFGENALERKALAGKLWRGGTKPGLAWVRPTGLGCTTELKQGVDRFGKKPPSLFR